MELFPEDACTFSFDSISRKYCVSIVNNPDDIALISATGEIATDPHSNTGLEDNFKVAKSPDFSFKSLLD